MSIYDYSTTPGSNSSIDGTNIAEGCAPAGINNALRSLMADVAQLADDIGGALDTTGSSNTYAVTTAQTITAYADGLFLRIRANHTSSGAATLNVDSLGAKDLKKFTVDGVADIGTGDIQSGGVYDVAYDSGNDRLYGQSGRDTLKGGKGDDYLRGGTSHDKALGGSGKDTIRGDSGKDTLKGNGGNDLLFGGSHNDKIYGGSSADRLIGSNGNDRLYGGTGNDRLSGGKGKDHLFGGKGDDVLKGGSGGDRFVFTNNFGQDIITDFNAKSSREKIDLSSVRAITDFDDLQLNHMTQTGDDVMIRVSNNNHITLRNVDIDQLDAGDFIF